MEVNTIVIRQKGPTCGIYALLNGIRDFYSLKGCSASWMHKIVYKLLDKNKLTVDATASDGKTFIGEFFDIDHYLSFINANKDFIEREVLSEFKKSIKIKVAKIPFSQISEEKDALFIVPTLAEEVKKNGQATLHWISFQSNTKKYKVMDSRFALKRTFTLEKIRVKHFKLKDCSFYWKLYERKSCFLLTNEIEKYIRDRLKEKNVFLNEEILDNRIDYKVGEVLIIKN